MIQSAYAHYAFVSIHPFADGNGRVARALASVFTFRSHSVPLLILVEHKPVYLAALRRADEGDAHTFVEFVFERTTDAIALVEQTIHAAAGPDPEQEAEGLRAVYLTTGGYSQEQLDRAGAILREAFASEFERQAASFAVEGQIILRQRSERAQHAGRYRELTPSAGYRFLVDGLFLDLTAESREPARARVDRGAMAQLPIDAFADDEVLIVTDVIPEPFTARVRELLPSSSALMQIRMSVYVRRVLGVMLAELRELAMASLRGN